MSPCDPTAPAPWRLKAMGPLLRLLPPGTRGKTRLAKFLLGRKSRGASVSVSDRDGNRLYLPNLLEPVALSLFMDGVYEPEVMRFLTQSLGPAAAVVDVGANIGCFTVPIARRLGSAGRVIAVEASPSVAQILRRNVAANELDNVTVVERVVGAEAEASALFYEAPADHFGMGSSAPQFGVHPVALPATSVDRILDQLGVSAVAAMKVDVEGYEAHVFLGSQKLLGSAHPPRIIFEFCDWAEERAFPGRAGLAQELLLEQGFQLWRLTDYLAGGKSLREPVRQGFESIVAIRRTERSPVAM